MSFATPSQDLVIVANERHEHPENHTYAVVVDDGLPVHCSCPAEKRFPTPCKHRLAVALNEPVLAAAEASDDEREAAESEGEPVPIADGGHLHGREHADGCTDPHCEGLDAPGRPELSYECWAIWSAEPHDWSDERDDDEDDTTPSEDDMTDLAVEQVVAAFEARGEI